jgi:fluoride exporter
MNMLLLRYLAIGSAGFIGTVLRYAIGTLFGRFNYRFPLGTLIINITGSMFLGWFATYVASRNISDNTRLAIAVGFVGGYTTFSTFMFDTNKLASEGAVFQSAVNLIGSVVLGLLGVRLGILMAKW